MSEEKKVKVTLRPTRCPDLYQHIIALSERFRASEIIELASRGLRSENLAKEIVEEILRALPDLETRDGKVAPDPIAQQESTLAPTKAIDPADAFIDQFLGETR